MYVCAQFPSFLSHNKGGITVCPGGPKCVCVSSRKGNNWGKRFAKHCVFKFLQLSCMASNPVFTHVEERQTWACVCVWWGLCVCN